MLEAEGIPVATVVAKVGERRAVDAVDLIAGGKVQLVVNTPAGPRARGRRRPHPGRRPRPPGALLTTVAAARPRPPASPTGRATRWRSASCRSTTARATISCGCR